MFLELQEHQQISRGEKGTDIHLAMGHSSIAAYLGLTPAALSRAFRALSASKIIAVRDRRHVRILDRKSFNQIADARAPRDAAHDQSAGGSAAP